MWTGDVIVPKLHVITPTEVTEAEGSIHHAVQSLDEAPARYTHTANVDFAASSNEISSN